MAKQTFTAGQVLTATQMNNLQANDYNWSTNAQVASYVLVAADAGKVVTMTNAAATTITVNTSLFTAGDTVRIINLGAGACTITAGTATVSTAGSLILVQNQAGTLWFSSTSAAIFIPDDKTPGLQYITGATFSAASTVIADGCFTTTYRNYLLVVEGNSASGFPELRFYYRTGGTDNTNATYTNGLYYGSELNAANAVYGGSIAYGRMAFAGDTKFVASMQIFAPQVAAKTGHSGTFFSRSSATAQYGTGGGFFDNTTQFDGIKLFPASSTISGTYRIYGLADA